MNTNAYANAIRSIKTAILRSRYRAAALANREMLALYFSVGGYISANSREGKWGTNAIGVIARQLQNELPGLRGFSAANIKKMRLFYEAWASIIQSSVAMDDLASIGSIAEDRSLSMNDLQNGHAVKLTLNRSSSMKPEYAGKLNFYLSVLDTLVKLPTRIRPSASSSASPSIRPRWSSPSATPPSRWAWPPTASPRNCPRSTGIFCPMPKP